MNDDRTPTIAHAPIRATLVMGVSLGDSSLRRILSSAEMETAIVAQTIDAQVLQNRAVARVICPLFARAGDTDCDAISVIDQLAEAGFSGEVVVLSPPLLRPKMVESELRSMARGMKMRLILGAMPPLDYI